ncbi:MULTISPECIES: amidohydrolase family protein [Empedobacter]|uniref:amidohydrolase family protein n=1 Tax=Empedobacter TaxID=59734 RepID=UPI001C57B1AC|nr:MULTISPECIES: amidohydrolase family protein [Empedobacter]MBW1619058.1 amidohydrolase family protein [Empedobacter falsenii]MDM1040186.1 amidohydrolase family protein [Empedobacter brevis]MDM1134118.1 amidohydrolase family protein [Empedobacter sp. R750]
MKLFDAHFHIINPKFPLVENNGYLPPKFTAADYLTTTSSYDIAGGAIVSGSFQAFDQEYLIDALQTLGNNFFGVANIPATIKDEELERLSNANIVAVRFNVKRGGSEKIEHIEKLSNYLFEKYGWHTELYIDSVDLSRLKSVLQNIPQFSIDHLGLSKDGLKDLYYWVEKGVKVKATGFGRIDFDPIEAMKTIYHINPKALMFGTDLPSTRAKIPFSDKDVQRVKENFSADELENIFYNNAFEWYSRVEIG